MAASPRPSSPSTRSTGLLARIFGGGGDTAKVKDEDLVRELVDRIVEATDRKLALISGYRKKLGEPAQKTLDYLRGAVRSIPGPTELSARSWSDDTTVRALFAQAKDISSAASRDRGLRDFFAAHKASDHCFALAAFDQVEKRVLANAMQGDMVQSEVARTTVSFQGARFLAPAADERSARVQLVRRSVDYLGQCALRGLGPGGKPDAIARKLDHVIGVLGAPEAHFRIEPCTVALDAMNFSVPKSKDTVTPKAGNLWLGDRGPFAVLVASVARDELQSVSSMLDEAMKHL